MTFDGYLTLYKRPKTYKRGVYIGREKITCLSRIVTIIQLEIAKLYAVAGFSLAVPFAGTRN